MQCKAYLLCLALWRLLVPRIAALNNLEDANNFTAYFEVKCRFAQISGDFPAGEQNTGYTLTTNWVGCRIWLGQFCQEQRKRIEEERCDGQKYN